MKFSKKFRLSKKKFFDRAFKNPKKVSYNGIVIFAKENFLQYPRIGLIISKKNIKHSSERNRIKRLIRECFRLNLFFLKKMDFIVLVKRNLKNLENRRINKTLNKLWTQYYHSPQKL
ncbi:ribonuclease P protein component [Candidatus Riesia pediculicola]|uniref:Ribonuclease P protein component n=1 Tax=Riesia pediculicola (strain USDA) TaxID=515618 RepID=D4G7W4_RIEPU|nr:ribonuclease P protein component [Candidatus Riesia pediculicola]ADD79853.1 ribonuclease P protein component [Candidatus Riesia pediculicola USDA]ARC53681.1 hypothetical protein AOE55_00720 [Candidatus Riesia pediculicola]ARC54524.1 hypothetical protein AOE56_00770 [Candidatus Riesia pediculicola]QOJ86326.1 ribonuclease P protein component [Candidatus Riesia pediculicola]